MRIAAYLLSLCALCACTEQRSESRAAKGPRAIDTVPKHVSAPGADTLRIERHANGIPSHIILQKDSGDCRELHLSFYENGRLRWQGCQGTVVNTDLSTGMSTGRWTFFDSLSGRIDSTIQYNNEVEKDASIEKRSFHPNGALKAVEIWNNYILYETEPRRKGVWKYYDVKGRLLRSLRY